MALLILSWESFQYQATVHFKYQSAANTVGFHNHKDKVRSSKACSTNNKRSNCTTS